MKNRFNFCPKCGAKTIDYVSERKWFCSTCGFELYNNVAAAVGIVIYDKYDNVLFELRAKEPRKGCACLPGGFVDPDEQAENAIIRECREEIGMEIEDCSFLCSFPNVYPYKDIVYKTCDIFFTAKLPSQFDDIQAFISSLKPQESEVAGFAYYKIQCAADIEKIPLAFESARKTLLYFIEKKNGEY